MLSRLFVRRLFLPYLLLILFLLTAVAVFELVRLTTGVRDTLSVFWFLLGCGVIGIIGAVLLAYFYSSRQTRQAIEVLSPLAAAKGEATNLDSVLQNSFLAYQQFVAQAGKDKAHLLTILSSMSDGLIAIDQQQRLTLANQAADELLHASLQKAQGQPLYESLAIPPLLAAVHEVMLTGQQKTIQVGPIHSLYLEITLCRLPADRAGGMVIVIHDITESRRYEDLRKEFVANVSHELRTPLTMIKGFVETLRDGAMDDRPRALQYLSTVERHSDQLTNLVNDLLDLSRLDSAADIGSPLPVHIDPLLRRVEEITADAARKKGHTLTFSTPSDLPPVLGNPDSLQRAVLNLVDNAIKYTKDSGEIRVTASQINQQIAIEVQDNGIGIPAEDLSRIFERFYRVDRSRSREMGGTGLGLSIVKHIIQNHGGTVDVASNLGNGSRFTIRLPIAKSSASAPPTNDQNPRRT